MQHDNQVMVVASVSETLKQNYFQELPESALRVQDSNVSRSSAIHIAYHNLQRSSSESEPRDPLLKIICGHTVYKIRMHEQFTEWVVNVANHS